MKNFFNLMLTNQTNEQRPRNCLCLLVIRPEATETEGLVQYIFEIIE